MRTTVDRALAMVMLVCVVVAVLTAEVLHAYDRATYILASVLVVRSYFPPHSRPAP